MKLTKNQRLTLEWAVNNNWIVTEAKHDRTCRSLQRHGLLEWNIGGKYSGSYWGLTPAGFEIMGLSAPWRG